jgi:hypothetical protein
MSRDRAAYMREYRARKAAAQFEATDRIYVATRDGLLSRIRELEEEVRHLKAELAKRPVDVRQDPEWGHLVDTDRQPTERFNTRPFTPVPKKR